jgi:hypothetical protein
VLPLLKREVTNAEIEVSFRGSRAKKDAGDTFEAYYTRTPRAKESFRRRMWRCPTGHAGALNSFSRK